jgi:hypothetical protein
MRISIVVPTVQPIAMPIKTSPLCPGEKEYTFSKTSGNEARKQKTEKVNDA